MQAIQTKYIGPARVRGSRIKASCDAGSITVHLDNSVRIEVAHANAARQLADKLGWVAPYYGPMHSGALPDGSYAHVFAEPERRGEREHLLANLLAELLDWAREHTSPRDANSPHELLVRVATVLDGMTEPNYPVCPECGHKRGHSLGCPRRQGAEVRS